MGCTASVVQIQALRSLMGGNCARTCSDRQEQISLEVLQSSDGELDSRPRTIIITLELAGFYVGDLLEKYGESV
ncbi:dedicator of cytokinesis protein 10 isoform X1 [Tachysurus ichikawai]